MSTTSNASQPGGHPDSVNWLAVFSFWLFMCAVFVVKARYTADTTPLLGDTDDAMRLVQVRDLIGGQSWFDTTQFRMNPPDGTSVHWSRLVDAPIAAIILVLGPFLGTLTETVAVYAWPLLLLGVLLAVSAHLCVRLLGGEALLPAVVLPVLSATLLFQFAPGRIDHHNVQVLLTLLLVSATLGSWRSHWWAVVAGLAAATSLAIGIETIPFVVMAIVTFGAIWVFAPAHGTATRSFGLTFGIATVAIMLATVGADRWMQPACDALSIVYAAAAVASGAALAIVPALAARLHGWWSRLLVIGVLGIAAAGFVAIMFPQCLHGPYGQLDPWLRENWLSQISEAKPVWASIEALPAYSIGIVVPPLISLIAIAVKLWLDPRDRPQWLILGAFLAFAILVMVIQIRGARLAAILAVPGAAWVIVAARLRYLTARTLANTLGLVLAWLVFSGMAVAVAVTTLFPDEGDRVNASDVTGGTITKAECFLPSSFDALRAMPPTLLMAPSDLGAHVLEETAHSVVAGPYHRNESGLLDTFRFFDSSEATAREILDRHGIDTVVLCTGLPELRGFEDASEDSIVTLLRRGRMPDWLEEIGDPAAPIRIFRLRPPAPGFSG